MQKQKSKLVISNWLLVGCYWVKRRKLHFTSLNYNLAYLFKKLDHTYVVSLRDTLGAGSFSRCCIDKDRLYRILTGSQEKFLKGRRCRRVQKKCKMAIESK